MIEYTCHKIVYTPFKETNSKSFAKKNKQFVYPLRWNDKSFKKYSKIVTEADQNKETYLACPERAIETPMPVKKLSPRLLPNKR